MGLLGVVNPLRSLDFLGVVNAVHSADDSDVTGGVNFSSGVGGGADFVMSS